MGTGRKFSLMFADDIVICSESREQAEENLESVFVFYVQEGEMKSSKTEYMCE